MTLGTLSSLTKFLRIGGRRPGSLQAVSRQLCPTSAEPRRGDHERATAAKRRAGNRAVSQHRAPDRDLARPGKAGTGAEWRRTPRTHVREARLNSADWRNSPKAAEWLLLPASGSGIPVRVRSGSRGCDRGGGPCAHGRGPAGRRAPSKIATRGRRGVGAALRRSARAGWRRSRSPVPAGRGPRCSRTREMAGRLWSAVLRHEVGSRDTRSGQVPPSVAGTGVVGVSWRRMRPGGRGRGG